MYDRTDRTAREDQALAELDHHARRARDAGKTARTGKASMTTIDPDRLKALDTITLDHGGHSSWDFGHCAMEVVAWLAGLGHTDAPSCASPVLCRYTIALNDRWDAEKRQTLKPYLPRMVGTANDGKDAARERIAAEFVARDLMPPWLRLAGLDDDAAALEALAPDAPRSDLRRLLYVARDHAWEKRRAWREVLQAKVREHLKAKGSAVAVADAVAAAAADAAAVAAAVAVAVAVADAVADAVAAAVAAAVADAVAAADAVADAAAVADAVADAVAAAAAAAVADAAADAGLSWNQAYNAAYKAARPVWEKAIAESEHPQMVAVRDLVAAQRGFALDLLDRMIKPEVVAS